jgi:hypothetical protein
VTKSAAAKVKMDRGGVLVELVVKLIDALVGGLTDNGRDGGKRESARQQFCRLCSNLTILMVLSEEEEYQFNILVQVTWISKRC